MLLNRIHENSDANFWCQEVYEICTMNELFIGVFRYWSPNPNTVLINHLTVYCSLKKTIPTDITFPSIQHSRKIADGKLIMYG